MFINVLLKLYDNLEYTFGLKILKPKKPTHNIKVLILLYICEDTSEWFLVFFSFTFVILGLAIKSVDIIFFVDFLGLGIVKS